MLEVAPSEEWLVSRDRKEVSMKHDKKLAEAISSAQVPFKPKRLPVRKEVIKNESRRDDRSTKGNRS